jgi:hypothetical protein
MYYVIYIYITHRHTQAVAEFVLSFTSAKPIHTHTHTHTHTYPSARSFTRSPSSPPPSFTQFPFPPRSLVRDGHTSPRTSVISRRQGERWRAEPAFGPDRYAAQHTSHRAAAGARAARHGRDPQTRPGILFGPGPGEAGLAGLASPSSHRLAPSRP